MPTTGPAWTVDHINGDHVLGGSSQPGALAGYPSISVPAGHVFGLPVGVTFLGRAFSEARLVALAYAFEQATHARQAPAFAPSV
jgi:amidase